MSVWEKVFKNPKSKVLQQMGSHSLSVPGIKLAKRSYQLPSLMLGLALGTSYTKRTFLGQVGTEMIRWNPEGQQGKSDMSVFRVESVISDTDREISVGEEALSNFVSDRSDPPCTLFFQPLRFLLSSTKISSFVATNGNQKILHQAPSNQEIYEMFIQSQYKFLWDKAHRFFTDVKRFQIGQVVVEYPDYYSTADVKRYRQWFVQAAEKFFPPILSPEEDKIDLKERFVLLPESVITFMHWLTDKVEPKLASNDMDLKKLMMRYGILPRITDPITFLVVTMGATHSRVVRLRVKSISHMASAKRAGETVTVAHNYLGRIGFGGDHISCAFLDEEEERRYGATTVHKVSTFSRKVMEDWEKINHVDGQKHFEELFAEQFSKAIGKLADLTLKGFSENPENTVIILGGKVFEHSYFKEYFKKELQRQRIPSARIVTPSPEDVGIERICSVLQFHQKGLGRLLTIKSGLETEGAQRFTWRIGKVVEGTLVDTILDGDNRDWNEQHPRDFSVAFERGVRRLNLGYQKTSGGISQLWANVTLKTRVLSPIQVTFRTEAPDDLKIIDIKVDGKETVTPEDFQIEMLIAGEHPSLFPLYDKLVKVG